MKLALFVASLLWITGARAKEAPTANAIGGDFQDPRQILLPVEWIRDGTETADARPISRSILIICWMPAPNGERQVYQISGIAGYHTREHVERFLSAFYELAHSGGKSLNLIVAGNNWGTGRELKDTLEELSKKKLFSVFYLGGW